MRLWVFCLCLALAPCSADEYAVLVAGSNGYWNYRHQADICHAYQVLISHGFNPDNIILFSYDDVPSAALNPFPSKLFNAPGTNPTNVNLGCVKDYTGVTVNVANFLAVITGNATGVTGGNGRVLKSGPNDNVFINFVDHGAPGLVAFPSTYLYADQLNTALTYMSTHQMFKQLVFYLEACESGSMFTGTLPTNTKIFATTAANTTESSWGSYCPPAAVINGKNMLTCLGDLYSVNWMQDSDTADFSTETLQQQFVKVRALTNQSHASEFGDMSVSSDTLNQFQGAQTSEGVGEGAGPAVNWDSHEAKFQFLTNLAQVIPTDENQQLLAAETQFRLQTTNNFEALATALDPWNRFNLLNAYLPVADFPCLRGSIENYEATCGELGEFGLKYVQVLVNACESGFAISDVAAALAQACPSTAFA